MSLFYIFLTVLMFGDCFILVLLILLQLPKKDAGAGLAFGSGATDALFGAGSGNVLTKITKYSAGIFFGLAIIMAMVSSSQHQRSSAEALRDALMKQAPAPMSAPSSFPSAAPSGNGGFLQTPLLSNLPPAQTTIPTTPPAAKSTLPGTNK
jgi:preprotein translocase subunit SecG